MTRQQVGFEYGKVIIMNTTPLSATKLSLAEVVTRFIAAFQQVLNANPTCNKYEMAYPANASYAEVEAIKDYCVSHGLKVTHLEGPPRMCITLSVPVSQPEFVITPSVPAPQPEFVVAPVVPAPQPEVVVTPAVPAPQPVFVRDEIVNLFLRTLQAHMSGIPTCPGFLMPYPADATPAERTAINDKCIAEGFCVDSTTHTDRVILTIFTPARQRFMAKFISVVQPVSAPAPQLEPTPANVYLPQMPVVMQQASERVERTAEAAPSPAPRKGPWYTDPRVVSEWHDVSECYAFVDGKLKIRSSRVIELALAHKQAAVQAAKEAQFGPRNGRKTFSEIRLQRNLALLKYKMVLYLEQYAEADVEDTYVRLQCSHKGMSEEAISLVVSYLRSLGHVVKLMKIKSPSLSRDSDTKLNVDETWAMHVLYRRSAALDYQE